MTASESPDLGVAPSATADNAIQETPVTFARVTDAELDRLRGLLGQVITVAERPYLTEVTRDAIANWAYATGDFNPMYHDSAWASGSKYGEQVAPPTMLFAFSRTSVGYRGGLPGVHSMFGGAHFRWKRPLRLGQKLSGTTIFEALDELPSRFAGRMFKQVSTTTFADSDGEVGSITGWGMRVERKAASKRMPSRAPEQPKYTRDEITTIASSYAAEREAPFGDRPISSVEVGASLGPLVRGPYSGTTAVAFEQAWGGLFVRAHGFWFERIEKHPALGIYNSNGVPEPPEAVHWNTPLARAVGVPDAYDYGPERIAWMAVLLVNWAGPNAFLEELYCEVRGFNIFGDLTSLIGTVRAVDAEHGTVTVDVWAENQRKERTVIGWARIRMAE